MDRLRWIDKPGWRPPAMTTAMAVVVVLAGLAGAVGLGALADGLGAPEWLSMDLAILTILGTLFWVGRSPRKR